MARPLALAVGIACAAVLPASALPTISTTQAGSFRGDIRWHVILCDFRDTDALAAKYNATPRLSPAYYQGLFFTPGTHGLYDYVHSVSYGAARVTGDVHGWYTETKTYASAKAARRSHHYSDCIAAAKSAGYSPPAKDRVYVITAPGIDLVGFEGSHAVGGDWQIELKSDGSFSKIRPYTALPEIAHEFGHGIGLGHSFSNDLTWVPAKQGANAEYDNQFDLMSAAHIFTDPTGVYGGGPPFLDAHHLDEMGWIPMSRIVTVGGDDAGSRTVTLASLTHPEASGDLLARVLFDPDDQFHYYTVEFRTADSWDSGWANKTVTTNKKLSITYPNAMIMINEVEKNEISRNDPSSGKTPKPPTPYQNGSYYTSLIRQLGPYAGSGDGIPVQSLNAHGISISVVNITGNQATVNISTNFRKNPGWTEFGPLTCQDGYVWRAADDLDYVCVTPAARQEAADENASASKHAHGSHCDSGYVSRAAFPHDKVCVTPAQRASVRADNAQRTDRLMKQSAFLPPPNSGLSDRRLS